MREHNARCPISPPIEPGHPRWQEQPETVLAEARESGDGVHWLAHLNYWLITRDEHIRRILSDPDTFNASNAQTPLDRMTTKIESDYRSQVPTVPTVSDADSSSHARIRKILVKELSARAVDTEFAAGIDTAAQVLAERVAARKGPVDLVENLADPLPARVMFSWLGFDHTEHDHLRQWCQAKTPLIWGRLTEQDQRGAIDQLARVWAACRHLVDERRTRPADDLASKLVRDGELSTDEITSAIYALVYAGWETTAGLITHTVRAFLQRPDLWSLATSARVVDEVIEEVLRLDSPVIAWRRKARRNTMIGDTSVPAGADLLLSTASANRDPRIWRNPTTLTLGRPRGTRHLAFGGGLHRCPGVHLAIRETRAAVQALRTTCPYLVLASQEGEQRQESWVFTRRQRLWVTITHEAVHR